MANSGKDINFGADLVPTEDGVYDLGSGNNKWNAIYAANIDATSLVDQTDGAELAEVWLTRDNDTGYAEIIFSDNGSEYEDSLVTLTNHADGFIFNGQATGLTTNAGSTANPVYFSHGVPVKTSYRFTNASLDTNTTTIPTSKAVSDAIAAAQEDAAVYQGTVTAADHAKGGLPDTHKSGWYWVVAKAGTYAGEVCEVGDMIFCNFTDTWVEADGESVFQSDFDVVQGNYTLPTASASTLGGVKVGTNLSISSDVLSADLGGVTLYSSVPGTISTITLPVYASQYSYLDIYYTPNGSGGANDPECSTRVICPTSDTTDKYAVLMAGHTATSKYIQWKHETVRICGEYIYRVDQGYVNADKNANALSCGNGGGNMWITRVVGIK